MTTLQKQFPVNWLTSGRLASMIHCAKPRRSGGAMLRGFDLVELSAKFLKIAFEIKKSQRHDWETPSLS